jgi:FAD/FMN-containing dehydrogenase
MDKKKAELMEIVGYEGVLENPESGEQFLSGFDQIPPMRPRFKIKPRTVDEVQKIVLWANRTQTSLVPLSSGEPHLRSDTVPEQPESVIVDLSGMNKILKIDRRNRLVLIQPGVTHKQLLPELRKEGLRINMPLMPRSNKSVITSLLEREPVMSPKFQWSLLEPLRSLEIIWGNGDKFYSGHGMFRGEKESDWKEGLVPVAGVGAGPSQLDFYKFVSAAQGSMGIVTWASVKCEVLPDIRKLFFIPANKLEDLVDFIYKLLKFRFGDELFILNNSCLAYLLAGNAGEVESLKNVLPAWTVVAGITGGQIFSREKVEAQENDIRDIAQQSGLNMTPELPGCPGYKFMELMLKSSEEPYWKLRYKGDAQEIFFLTTLDKTPDFVKTMNSSANEHCYAASDVGVYIQPAHQGVSCHCEFILPVNHKNPSEVQRVQNFFGDAGRSLFRQGAFFSRPYGKWADMVYNADAMTKMATQKVKQIFDPNNILNPGKLCF